MRHIPSKTVKENNKEKRKMGDKEMRLKLEAPTEERLKEGISVEQAILKRKSRRRFSAKKLTVSQFSHVVWAASTIPSAGALYPLEFYVVVGENAVEGIEAGIYHLVGKELALHKRGDFRKDLAEASLRQMFIADAPFSLVISAEYERTTRRYGKRGIRYVHMEAGHAGQNIYLECESLSLATVAIGAFHDDAVSRCLSLPKEHRPLYIFPVGFGKE